MVGEVSKNGSMTMLVAIPEQLLWGKVTGVSQKSRRKVWSFKKKS